MTPVTLIIAFLGVLVTGMTTVGVLLIGLTEAADSDHSRYDDLSAFERKLVNRAEEMPEVASQRDFG